MFWMLIKRLASRPGLTLSLMVGLAAASTLAATVPIYADGALKRMLVMELSAPPPPPAGPDELVPPSPPPGTFWVTATGFGPVAELESYLQTELPQALEAPVSVVSAGGRGRLRGMWRPEETEGLANEVRRFGAPAYSSGLWDEARVVEGRLPRAAIATEENPLPPLVEAVVSQATLDEWQIQVGDTLRFLINPDRPDQGEWEALIVGAIVPMDPDAPFWYDPRYPSLDEARYSSRWLNHYLWLVEADFAQFVAPLPGMDSWGFHMRLDPDDLAVASVPTAIRGLVRIEQRIPSLRPGARVEVSPLQGLAGFSRKATDLRLPLAMLTVPGLLVVAFFVGLVASLAVEGRRAEVAALTSRGASRLQILAAFAFEGLLLAGVAAATGPPVGMVTARFVGAAVGFLRFVDRSPLPVAPSADAYLYAGAAAMLGWLAYLLPAVPLLRGSIVTAKQAAGRSGGTPFWEKAGLDLLLLGACAYGYRILARGVRLSADDPALLADPLLLALPAAALFGAGLLAARLFPWVISLLMWLTNRWAGPSLSLALTQLSRQPARYRPLLVLLVLTTGVGVYSAVAAHSLDRTAVDRIRYRVGADLVLEEQWRIDSETGVAREPAFLTHQRIPGIEAAARVLTMTVQYEPAAEALLSAPLVAVQPHEFSQVAWFRADLAPAALDQYLLLLARDPRAVLVTPQFAQTFDKRVGDPIDLVPDWALFPSGNLDPDQERLRQPRAELYIAGIISYWPGMTGPSFFVANLDTVEQLFGIRPYQVWLRLADGMQPAAVVKGLAGEGIGVLKGTSAEAEVYWLHTGIPWVTLAGILSLVFLTALLVTLLTFWLYVVLGLSARLPQFGILRAIGVSVPQLLGAIGAELLLVVAVGLLSGSAAGGLACRIFVPLLAREEAGPPFQVLGRAEDLTRLFAIIGLIALVAFGRVALWTVRVRLHEAIKMGEEA